MREGWTRGKKKVKEEKNRHRRKDRRTWVGDRIKDRAGRKEKMIEKKKA